METETVVASLEGQRVDVAGDLCILQEYNFATNEWQELETVGYPMGLWAAEQWVRGWNSVDRWAAIHYLTDGM